VNIQKFIDAYTAVCQAANSWMRTKNEPVTQST